MGLGSQLLELLDRPWSELSEEEQEAFSSWLQNAKGVDLYHWGRHARRGRKPSSLTMEAVTKGPADEPK